MIAPWLPAGLAAAAAFVLVPSHPAALLAGRSMGAEKSRGATRRGLAKRFAAAPRWARLAAIAVAGVAGAVAAAGATARFGTAAIGLSIILATAAIAGTRMWAARRAARARSDHRARVRRACDILASELRAGGTPSQALEIAAGTLPLLREACSVSRMGGDVPAALARAGRADGAEGLERVAAAWATAERSGAGFAGVLDRLVDGLRRDEETRAEVTAQLAAPRATARLLALLPLAGLALGSGIGFDPFHVLVATPYGLGCLLVGGGLAAAGIWWVERLAVAAEGRR